MNGISVNLFLSKEVRGIINCLGTSLDDAINRILNKLVELDVPLTDYPPCPGKQGCTHHLVIITNPEYIELSKIYKAGDSRFSLRRLLYHVVNTEMYIDLGMEQIRPYKLDDTAAKLAKRLIDIGSNIALIAKKLEPYNNESINVHLKAASISIDNAIRHIQEELYD